MNAVYEFSEFWETVYVLYDLLFISFFIVVITFLGFKYLVGKAKLFIILPVCYLSFALTSDYKGFELIEKYSKIVELQSYTSFKGKLIQITQEEAKNYYLDSLDSPAFAEVIETSNGTLTSIKPRHSSVGDVGCLTNNLKSELEPYIEREIEINYVSRNLEGRNAPLLCVLKIMVSES